MKTPKDIKDLEDKIASTKKKLDKKEQASLQDNSSETKTKGLKVIAEFISGVFVGGAVGMFLDTRFNTKPFFLISLSILGIAAGFLNVYRFVKKEREN